MDQLPDEILDKIIQHIGNLADVIECRIVNRKWSVYATESMKCLNNTTLHFTEEVKLNEFFETMENKLPFLEFPFTKFNFHLRNLYYDDEGTRINCLEQLPKLFHQYGSHIRKLKFEHDLILPPFCDSDIDRLKIALPLLAQTPNLTQLSLDINCVSVKLEQAIELTQNLPQLKLPHLKFLELLGCFSRGSLREDQPPPWYDLALKLRNASPNLQQVKLDAGHSLLGSLQQTAFVTFRNVPRICLTGVFFCTTKIQDMTEFLKTPIHFTKLKLNLVHHPKEAQTAVGFNLENYRRYFYKFMEFQSNSLTNLTVFGHNLSNFRMPYMEVLRYLEIYFSTGDEWIQGSPFSPFTPHQLPGLKEIKLSNYQQNWRIFGFGLEVEPFWAVERLNLKSCQNWNREVQMDWDVLFPCLKTLEIAEFTTEEFRYFIEKMIHVRHLKLDFKKKTNDHFPYMVENICERTVCNIMDGTSFAEEDSPSFVNFQDLETLEVRNATYWILKTIVNISRFGILKPLFKISLNPCRDLTHCDEDILYSTHGEVEWIQVENFE